jgi:sec-independent protein translocase protein TatA
MELAVILVLALLVFGPKKLPEIGKGVGQAMREFKKASRDFMSSFNEDTDDRPRPAPTYDTYNSTPDDSQLDAPAGTEPVKPNLTPPDETRIDEPVPAAVASASNGAAANAEPAPAEPARDTAPAPGGTPSSEQQRLLRGDPS